MRTTRSKPHTISRVVLATTLLILCSSAADAQRRTPWTSSQIRGSLEPPSPYRLERAFPKLEFEQPVDLVAIPGTERMAMVELSGRILTFPDRGEAEEADLMADLSKHVDGLYRAYSIAFHPRVAENRTVYVSYVQEPEREHGSRVSRFKLTQLDPPRLDPDSEEIVLTWISGGHNGACLRFGPDGYLYISTGDGGPAFPPDPRHSGQDVSNLLSSILRIDVDQQEDGRPYAIPKDNPFVDLEGARGEVWCYGHRNPWKMSFDPANGDLWVGDVGWEMWELVFKVVRGGNYGWSIMEGSQRVHYDRPVGPTPILPPTIQHSHTESRSITGGEVYRGQRLPKLRGHYVYGDYVTGKLWAARMKGEQVEVTEIANSALQVITFATDRNGELYVVDYGGGIFRLAPNDTTQQNENFPTRLSQTGLFASVADLAPAPGVLPYSLKHEPWADYATAERLVAIPGDAQLGIETNQNPQVGEIRGQWKYPPDSVLVKTIMLETERGNPASSRRLETQIMHLDGDVWRPYTYVWNEAQDDATLAPAEGAELQLEVTDRSAPGGRRQQRWAVASRSQCTMCHTARGGVIYGFRAEQLDSQHTYDSGPANQLQQLDQWGLLAEETPEFQPLAAPDDPSASLNARARAYLHVNCAHCHRRGGGGTAAIELMYDLPWERTHATKPPTQGTFNVLEPRVVAPGDPYRSLVYYRMAKIGSGRMPHFGSQIVDRRGLRLIHDWISEMPAGEAPPAALRRIRQQQDEALQQLETDDDPEPALQTLLSTTSGALRLAAAIDAAPIDPAAPAVTWRNAIEAGAAHPDPRIRDLFEAYLPDDQRTKRLGAVVDRQRLLQLAGDADRGRKLFLSTDGVQCRNCHVIRGQGKAVGPDLSDVGKRLDRAQLLETILEPSRKIEPKWVTYTVLDADGKIHTGLIVERSAERVTLRTNVGEQIEIATDDIERMTAQEKSMMPELLLSDLTEQQVADLLSYLEQQRSPPPSSSSR